MWLQIDSRKPNAVRCRVGTADRDKSYHAQYISKDHEKLYHSKHSPAPNAYRPDSKYESTVKKSQTFRFGSEDRFSQVKPRERETRRLPGFSTPGPGSYVI